MGKLLKQNNKEKHYMKKFKFLFVALLTVILLLTLAFSASAETRKMGDIDGDDKVTASDARLALRAAVDLDDKLSELDKAVANVDDDEKITAADARTILRVAVDLETLTDSIHIHEPAEPVEENVTEATCTEDGACETVVYCAECKEELSREPKVLPALGHDKAVDLTISRFSLTGDNEIVYVCNRCGLNKHGEYDPSLIETVQLSDEVNETNVRIVNHFLNNLKTDWAARGMKFSAVDNVVSSGELLNSQYEMNWLMKSKVDAINLALGDGEKIPTKKSEFDAMLNEMMAGTNETQNTYTWPVILTKENFVLRGNDAVSLLDENDLASMTVETVTDFSGLESILPATLEKTREINMREDGGYWVVGMPGDFNLKDLLLAKIPTAANIVKITLKLKDGDFDSMDAFTKGTNLADIIDFNKNDFEMEDITSSFDGMENIGEFKADQSSTVKTSGTVTYYFDGETGKPLAAYYDTSIDTVNTFSLSVKVALSTLDAGASVSANSHNKTIYVFDPIV